MSAANTVAEKLWARFGQLTLQDIPADVQKVATHCMLDWFGCAVAGSREPLSEILRDELASETGAASLIGSNLRSTVTGAALINGAAGHALDYDDTGNYGHPTAPVMPAVLAVAEERGLSGAEVLTAYVAGAEVGSWMAAITGRQHYLDGWHSTATFGVFAAAAAVSRLLQFNTEQFGRAMGLAASQSSGVKANFGTMTKPFHAGMAAERGCFSARLAARGFTSNPEAIEGNQGWLQAAGAGNEFLSKLDGVADKWYVPNTLFKYHAACYLTHSSINNIVKIRDDVLVDNVESITLRVHPSILDVCGLYERPQTGLEAKFSLKGTAAMAVSGIDTGNPEVFEAAVVQRPELQTMMEKVHIETDESYTNMQAKLRLVSKDGREFVEESDSGIPSSDLTWQEQALLNKFNALAQPVLGNHSAQLSQSLLNMADLPSVSELY